MGVLPYQRISPRGLSSPLLPSPPLASPLLLLLDVLISIPHPVSLVLLLGAANCESRLHFRKAGQRRHFMLTAGGLRAPNQTLPLALSLHGERALALPHES